MCIRCSWAETSSLMMKYHDEQWGVPVHDEQKHFEFLLLETMQAGLSWSIILKKREAFRSRFDGFDYARIAQYDSNTIEELCQDAGIIRNRRKITAAVNNAKRFITVQQEYGSFDAYIWGFTQGLIIDSSAQHISDIPASNQLSMGISRDMKRRGFSFIGPTVIYAHLQAIGVILDHVTSCFRYHELKQQYADWIIQKETLQTAWDSH